MKVPSKENVVVVVEKGKCTEDFDFGKVMVQSKKKQNVPYKKYEIVM